MPKLWPLALAPLALALTSYAALLIVGFNAFVPRLTENLAKLGLSDGAGWTAGSAIYSVLWLVLSGPLFLILFGGFAIPSWEMLSRKVELTQSKTVSKTRISFPVMALDTCFRLGFALIAITVSIVLSLFGFWFLSGLISGFCMLFDLTAPAFQRRGIGFWSQPGQIFRCKGWFAMWLALSVMCLVPGLNLLILPWILVSSTLLVCSSDPKASIEASSSS